MSDDTITRVEMALSLHGARVSEAATSGSLEPAERLRLIRHHAERAVALAHALWELEQVDATEGVAA